MTTASKALVAALLAVGLGVGYCGTHHAAQARAELEASQRQQTALLEQITQLQRERDDATNRLVAAQGEGAALKPQPKTNELLKLRGEVGLLRRQLQEIQQAGSARLPEGQQMQDLRNRGQAAYLQLKALSDRLHQEAADPHALLEVISASGLQDSMLSSLLAERQELSARQQEAVSSTSQPGDLAGELANLDTKIENRSRGMVLALAARAEVMNRLLEDLPNSSGDRLLDSVIGLENFLNRADNVMGDFPNDTTKPEHQQQFAPEQAATDLRPAEPSIDRRRLDAEATARAREAMRQKMATLDAEQHRDATTPSMQQ